MGLQVFIHEPRETSMFSKRGHQDLITASHIDQHKRPALCLYVEDRGIERLAFYVTTYAHLDQIFEAIMRFDRYASVINEEAKDYARKRGVEVGTIEVVP